MKINKPFATFASVVLLIATSSANAALKYASVNSFIPTQSDTLTINDPHYAELNKLSDLELKKTVNSPTNLDYVTVKQGTMQMRDGHTRIYLLKKRGYGSLIIPYDELVNSIKYYDQ